MTPDEAAKFAEWLGADPPVKVPEGMSPIDFYRQRQALWRSEHPAPEGEPVLNLDASPENRDWIRTLDKQHHPLPPRTPADIIERWAMTENHRCADQSTCEFHAIAILAAEIERLLAIPDQVQARLDSGWPGEIHAAFEAGWTDAVNMVRRKMVQP